MNIRGVVAGRTLGIAAMLAGAGQASATWSIIIIDTRTGEVGVASATCLTGFDLRANTPVLIPGVGAATAQSSVDATGQNRVLIRDLLDRGVEPQAILDALASFDSGHQTRQYGIADTTGRAATFSGSGAGAWAGGETGQVGDLVYAVQGNVLTGQPVVTEAVRAIVETPGDLPAKLMASMEAARLMGGDGRCSCSGGNPTACGAPPPIFAKSAHIAYMLIARAGDRAGCNGIYNAGNRPYDVAFGDMNGDGKLDIVSCTNAVTSVLLNTHDEGDVFATFAQAVHMPAGADSRGVEVADLNGDGNLDIISAAYGADRVGVQLGNGDGTFQPVTYVTAGDGPRQVAVADFNGDGLLDVACTNQLSDDVSVFLNTGSGLGAQARRAVGDAPGTIRAADLDGDGDIDLAVVVNGFNRVGVLLNNGAGGFTLGPPNAVGANPTEMRVADLDGDGDADIVTTDRDAGSLSLLFNNGSGAFSRTAMPVGATPTRVAAIDVTLDGLVDLVVVSGTAERATAYAGDGMGGFVAGGSFATPSGLLDMEMADVTGDGLVDLAGATGNRSVLVVEARGPGVFNDGVGCAMGDYFMNFNVANAAAADPEPVFTLRNMFDQWRADLTGRPDAVVSRVVTSAPLMPHEGRVVMTIELLDWAGDPITIEPESVDVAHAPGSAGLSAIGEVAHLGGGVYEVVLTGPAEGLGTDVLEVLVSDALRPVELMPKTVLEVVASPADFNMDGETDVLDLLEFFDLFSAGDLRADLTGDGLVDGDDAALFVAAFTA